MPRYIDANDIIHRFKGLMTDGGEVYVPLSEVRKALQMTPTADIVPKSEVERLQAELDDKQFRCDSCDRIMLTGAEHRACVKHAKQMVAREIFADIERVVLSKIPMEIRPMFRPIGVRVDFSDGVLLGTKNALYEAILSIAELKKKYMEENNEYQS